MSWSAEREEQFRSQYTERQRKVIESIALVNHALSSLANDDDFQDDLNDPSVSAALKHWVGDHKLSAEDDVFDNHRVKSVLGKLQRLTFFCRKLGVGVPLNILRERGTALPNALSRELVEAARGGPSPPPPPPPPGGSSGGPSPSPLPRSSSRAALKGIQKSDKVGIFALLNLVIASAIVVWVCWYFVQRYPKLLVEIFGFGVAMVVVLATVLFSN
mmetsp:Transcript_52380/g.76559  ORF Transcript_52380/g.76559 Transcript_52380/m.76559 type:complete len:216 (+) Transcript_52380:95-742(+)